MGWRSRQQTCYAIANARHASSDAAGTASAGGEDCGSLLQRALLQLDADVCIVVQVHRVFHPSSCLCFALAARLPMLLGYQQWSIEQFFNSSILQMPFTVTRSDTSTA